MTTTRSIHTKNYIETMHGGNVAWRDINIQQAQSISKQEFLQL